MRSCACGSRSSKTNDCDLDGCTVAQGDCADSPTVNPQAGVIRGPGCPNGPGAEVCDGADNNCSGAPDEGNPGGGGACTTGQSGVCAPGVNQCLSGAVTCVRNVAPSAEVCDGLDNDCDGAADENNPGGGAACSTGQAGVCAVGTRTCQSGALACVRNVGPTTELCDGLDNNCAGGVDEGFNVNQACSSTNQGVCQPGTNQCQGNGTVACVSTVAPGSRTETCNNLDQYIDLATATGGSTGSICNPNITEVVDEILFGAIGASSRARLPSRPISGSLAAETTMPIARARVNGFDYDPANNTLLFFGTSPPAGTDVRVAYATFVYLN